MIDLKVIVSANDSNKIDKYNLVSISPYFGAIGKKEILPNWIVFVVQYCPYIFWDKLLTEFGIYLSYIADTFKVFNIGPQKYRLAFNMPTTYSLPENFISGFLQYLSDLNSLEDSTYSYEILSYTDRYIEFTSSNSIEDINSFCITHLRIFGGFRYFYNTILLDNMINNGESKLGILYDTFIENIQDRIIYNGN